MKIQYQIIKLVSGNLNEEEKKKLLIEIKNDDQLRKEYDRIKNAWSLSSYNHKLDSLVVEKSFTSFKNNIYSARRIKLISVFKYAAIILLFFSLGIVVNQYVLPDIQLSLNESEIMNVFHVPNGERADLTLSDGTRVWMNSGTKLSFPNTFCSKTREVHIEGEAYFDVRKSKKTFIVSTSSGNIEVLGTSFNVRAYDNLQFQTTLVEGKIEFKNESTNEILKPGHQLKLLSDGRVRIDSLSVKKILSWKDGVISFDHEPLGEVFKKLERHYDITIVADTSISSIKFTGEIKDETIEEFLNLVDRTRPINYKYDRKNKLLKINEK